MQEIDPPRPYPEGTSRPGTMSLGIQPIVRPWIDHVKGEISQITMVEPNRVSVSMVVEALMRAWHDLRPEQKVEMVRGVEFRTVRRFGRPPGKSTADWDSSLKP